MLLSWDWLKDFIDIKCNDVKEFCEAMTMSGSKVESFEELGQEIQNVVVGKIIEIKKHPDAEKLVICTVDIGAEKPLQIVTGATNVCESAIVPVACHNAKLPGGVKIKKTKLRGVQSEGMLCSLKELGLQFCDFPYAQEDGILILKEDMQVGQDILTALKLKDIVIDFEITSNRPDCLSILGLAREAAATYNIAIKEPMFNVERFENNKERLEVKEVCENLCKRYMLHKISDVQVSYSPLWLRARLKAVGIRPVNNIVDITNYVMLELGQPMHAFDADKVEGAICVRKAHVGEELLTLDGVLRKLDDSMLVIADKKKVLAIAGVMGGLESEITAETKNVIFESAVFDGTLVRQTAKKLGLRSESSARFGKGLLTYNCPNAIARACELVGKLGIADPTGATVDIINLQEKQNEIELDCDRINSLLGTTLTKEEITGCLKRLGFEILKDAVKAPVFRTDIECVADLAEEVARLFGYNNIPSVSLPGGNIAKPNDFENFKNKLASLAVAHGFYETVTYSMVSPKHFEKLLLEEADPLRNCVEIKNPLGEDKSIMRTTTIPSMLETLNKNISQKNELVCLFDMGCAYKKKNFEDKNGKRVVDERPMFTLGAYDIEGKNIDFFVFKGAIENILDKIGIRGYTFEAISNLSFMHPGRTAKVKIGELELGFIGQLYPTVAKNYELCRDVLIA
ncbi:MAG: phenylalanine--tRNA ligase subunit beta, partial [Oscillospiraceae bacterium]